MRGRSVIRHLSPCVAGRTRSVGTDTDVAGGKQGASSAVRKFLGGTVEQQTDEFTRSFV